MGLTTVFESTHPALLRPVRSDEDWGAASAAPLPAPAVSAAPTSEAGEDQDLLTEMRYAEFRARRLLEMLWEAEELLLL